MKLLPKNTRVDPQGPMTLSLDVAVVLLLFFGAGFLLDNWLGTMPVFMIVFTLLGSIGLFYRFRLQYEAKMQELEDQRRNRRPVVPGEDRAA